MTTSPRLIREALQEAAIFVAAELHKPCNHTAGEQRKLLDLLLRALAELDEATP